MDIVGIDHSPLAIRVCRERGVRNASVLPITQVSANKLGMFDTIVMTGNNFGLVGSRKRARWLLRRLLPDDNSSEDSSWPRRPTRTLPMTRSNLPIWRITVREGK